MIDAIFASSVTLLEEALQDVDDQPVLHLMLASPGGDGEVAVRLIRSLQARCSKLRIIVPDMAKSAGTIMCLGANEILMGPSGDLGPIDPQFPVAGRGLVGAKEIEAAVESADARVQAAPDTFPLYAGLLSDVNMLMVEQARSATKRSYSLLKEALEGAHGNQAEELGERLKGPLVDEATYHGAAIGPASAAALGLPVIEADTAGREWALIWALWTRYFAMGCFPAGNASVYEGRRASQVTPHMA
ncbi:SDH family Clp fold serine proteinase [Terrabacter terrae]